MRKILSPGSVAGVPYLYKQGLTEWIHRRGVFLLHERKVSLRVQIFQKYDTFRSIFRAAV